MKKGKDEKGKDLNQSYHEKTGYNFGFVAGLREARHLTSEELLEVVHEFNKLRGDFHISAKEIMNDVLDRVRKNKNREG